MPLLGEIAGSARPTKALCALNACPCRKSRRDPFAATRPCWSKPGTCLPDLRVVNSAWKLRRRVGQSLTARNTTAGLDRRPTQEKYIRDRRTSPLLTQGNSSLLPRRAVAPEREGRRRDAQPEQPRGAHCTGLFLPWVSSLAGPVRRQGECGNDPHQREEYP